MRNLRGSRKTKHKTLGLSSLFIIVIMLIFYNVYYTTKRNHAQSQPSITASSFTLALVRNDKRLLMDIVIPQQSEEITKWLSSHQPFFCPPGLDFPTMRFPPNITHLMKYTRIIGQNVHTSENFKNGNIINFNTFYRCSIDINSDRGLNFEVHDVVIEKKGNKWFVKSWRFVCESKRLAGCM